MSITMMFRGTFACFVAIKLLVDKVFFFFLEEFITHIYVTHKQKIDISKTINFGRSD